MRGTNSKNVLISEPGAADMADRPFLPYMWGTLKSYWERHGEGGRSLNWLRPIYLSTGARTALSPYADTRIDVLGLSCYIWNWDLQRRIAQHVKAGNPHCLVIAGGPHPDYKDPNFFTDHPYIDAVAVKDGEITFTNVLGQVINGRSDLSSVPGLYLPQPGGPHIYTGPAQVPIRFDHSPYLDQRAFYEQLVRSHEGKLSVTWETNRGCPYTCSYCDWGSNTMSKIRTFDMDRVREEVEWFARMKIWLIFSADANLGILPRDTEVADLICSARERYGYPKYLVYSNAKNNPDRSVAISRKLFASGLMMQYDLSIQHTDKEVLAATARSNISPEKQIAVVNELRKDAVPIEVQLIIGIPGDTYEKWKGCLTDLMERGIDGSYATFFYQLLPNAPAANPEFLEKWAVKTVERYVATPRHRSREEIDRELVSRGKFVVESKTFTQADWVNMQVYTAFVKALHTCSLTQQIARYLRLTRAVPYRDFYDRVIEDYCAGAEPGMGWHRRVTQHYENWLHDDDAVDFMEIRELPSCEYQLDPARWLFVQICLNLDAFFAGLRRFLLAQYPLANSLASAIDYQKELIILPTYDRRRGKSFTTGSNWVDYFQLAANLESSQTMGEPELMPGALVEVRDATSSSGVHTHALDWEHDEGEARWLKWLDRVVVGRNSGQRSNFQRLSLQTGAGKSVWQQVGRAVSTLEFMRPDSRPR